MPIIDLTKLALLVALGVSLSAAAPSKKAKIKKPEQASTKTPDKAATKSDGAAEPTVEESSEETWESYSRGGETGSVAEDITSGVRVEDIVEPPTDYHYAAFGKTDPFVPPMKPRDDLADSVEIPIVSPLQQFRTKELVIAGIWQLDTGQRKVLLMTPAREPKGAQGIIAKIEDPIGRRGGKIIDITKESITVREFTLAPDGTRQFEDVTLMFPGSEAPKKSESIVLRPGEKDEQQTIVGPASSFAPRVPGLAPAPGATAANPNAQPPASTLPGTSNPTTAPGAASPSPAPVTVTTPLGGQPASTVAPAAQPLPNQAIPPPGATH